MVRARLITGGSQEERTNLVEKLIREQLGRLDHPDLLVIDSAPSVTINQIRTIKRRLAMKPYSAPVKIIFICQAETITLPAQNALLKTLEEPPGEAIIFLVAPVKEALLPTILSRCQTIQLPQRPEITIEQSTMKDQLSLINSILKAGAGERVRIAEKYSSNREEAINFCQKQLVVWRKILRKKTRSTFGLQPSQITPTLRQIHQSLVLLNANINPRLVVENLLFSYPQTKPAKKPAKRPS